MHLSMVRCRQVSDRMMAQGRLARRHGPFRAGVLGFAAIDCRLVG